MTVITGLEALIEARFAPLAGQRVGLLTNPSAITRRLQSAYRVLTGTPDMTMTALFGPEHGFAGAAPDAEHIQTGVDARSGLPIFSLYGETYRPTADMLNHIDTLVCDIQDIGVRYYTYTWSVSHVLEAAGEHGVRVVILDRPNPLGGLPLDGPLLDHALSSFVGRFAVPVCHGMTLGELARMINATWNPTPAALDVIPCAGWRREMAWAATGLPWVPPSPNMPHLSTLQHYPGACLVEGTTLSEGRGTPLPFEIVGAPWIDGQTLADTLAADSWGKRFGAGFRPHTFQPTQSKWQGQYCQGVQVYVLDPARWRPIEVWLGVLITIQRLYPDHFAWLPQHPDSGAQHFDRLIGSKWVRRDLEAGIQAGKSTLEIIAPLAAEWLEDCHAFELQRQPFLLYN